MPPVFDRVIVVLASVASVTAAPRAAAQPSNEGNADAPRTAHADEESHPAAHAVSRNEPPIPERRVTVTGYVHADWVAFRQTSQDEINPSTGEPLNENRFLIRRARLRAQTDRGLVHGALELDANTIHGPQVRPWNAEVSVKWPPSTRCQSPSLIARATASEPFVIVSVGLLMTPFGLDVAELERSRPFLERTTMANELVPQSYDLGARVMGGFGIVNYALGIMNGDPIGERAFPGRDPNESKDLVARVGLSTAIVSGLRVDAGVSGITGRGFHAGQASSKDQLVWRDQNEDLVVQQTELQVVPGAPATPSAGFQRFALGADIRVHVPFPVLGGLELRGEVIRAKNMSRGTFVADPVARGRDLRHLGWSIGGTQELTRWAMIGVRYDTFDPDSDAQDQRPFAVVPADTSLSTWAFMAMARVEGARLVAEYDRRKNASGRDVTGAPTTLADDSLTFRAVVGF